MSSHPLYEKVLQLTGKAGLIPRFFNTDPLLHLKILLNPEALKTSMHC